MAVHYFVLTYTCLIGLLVYRKRFSRNGNSTGLDIKNKRFLILSLLCLFLVTALRSRYVGLDTRMYYWYYNMMRLRPGYGQDRWELFYLYISKLAIRIGSFQVILIICAAITFIGIGYFCYKNIGSEAAAFWYVFFFITLNLYFNSMHLIRQMCAIAITVNAYTVLRRDQSRKGYIKAGILILLGLGFHITSIFALAYFLPFLIKRITGKSIANITIIALIGGLLLSRGQSFLIRMVPRFSRYLEDDRLSTGRIGVYAAVLILIKIAMILYTLRLDPDRPENKEVYRLAYLTVISTAMFILQSRTQFALRIGYFYEVFMPMFIPVFINRFKRKVNRQIMYMAMFLFGLTYFVYMMHIGGVKSNRGCVPYTFFWQL